MADPKNPFDFGTGRIDKDQWLRDIDAEQGDFVSQYSSAVNKHRATLMREAFADLRRRIANGDMLNRTADGLYQFSSALSREDKHMQEAYQRALGFMGDLARRQIQAPPAAEPEKKKYSTKTLNERFIKYFNPSGSQESFTSLWNSYDDATRLDNIKKFLQNELNTGLSNYLDVEDYESLDKLKAAINDFIATPNITNLNRLGFTKNYLNLLKTEELEEEPKTEEELVTLDLEAQRKQYLLEQDKKVLEGLQNASEGTLNFTWTPGNYEDYLNNYFYNTLGYSQNNPYIKAGIQFELDEKDKDGNVIFRNRPYTTKKQLQQSDKLFDIVLNQYANRFKHGYLRDLEDYFSNFGTRYESLYNDNKEVLRSNLSKLFATADNKGVANWENYFTKTDDGYLINGSLDDYGNYAILTPQGIIKRNMYKDSYRQSLLQYKEGGVIKGADGFVFDASKYHTKPSSTPTSSEQSTSKLENTPFSTAEQARIGATIADIASMGAAFVPGYGTAASAILGLGSTATNFGADLADGQGLWGATKNAGFGLAADVMGLIPGLGGIGKGAKMAKNLMWAVPKMLQWVNTVNGLGNAKEIKNSIMKLTSPSSMNLLDWLNISQALQIMTGHGRSVVSKSKIAGMLKRQTTTTDPEYYIFTNRGKEKVSDETFKKLRETRGSKERQKLVEELMGSGVKLQLVKGNPLNTSTRFGAFKEVPGKTQVTVLNPHKGWLSDENLYLRGQNWQGGLDFRNYFNKINPYSSYYSSRNKGGELPAWLRRPVEEPQIIPEGTFGITKLGMASALSTPTTKRKTLTEEQKAARRQKIADKKKKEQALKQLEELKRNQHFALAEEVPQAGTYANIKSKQLEAAILSSKYANEVELPIPAPRPAPGPRSEAFNLKYGKALGKKEYGGVLKALRNGGIIKAKWGDDTSNWMTPLYNPENSKQEEAIYTNPYFPNIKYNGTAPWYKSRFSGESVVNLGNDDSGRANLPGGLTGNNLDYAFTRNQAYVKSGLLNKLADILGYFDLLPSPVDANNLEGLTAIYNKAIDELYLPFTSGKNVPDYLKTDATKHNLLFRLVYGSRAKVNGGDDNYDIGWNPDIIKTFGSASFARRPVNYETKWEDDLKNNLALAKDRVSKISHNGIEGYVYTDENGRIHPLTNDLLKLINGQQAPQKLDKESSKATDSEGELKTVPETKYKNPTDPTPYIIAGKTAMGLLGNRNIYKNLLDEMPQAPLRDPIDRKLAIVGWQEAIKQGLNQLADLRNATWMQHGSDQLTNLAGMYETEGKGRDIMNAQFMKDSERLFDTALKSWNLDNDDTLYNLGVGDANRKSIADRARMMAQIRAAWRSGDNNIIMGALSDAGNWMMKNYQRESDLIDLVKQQQLGTREQFMENYVRNKHSDYDSLKAKLADPNTSDTEKANIRTKIQQWHLDAIKEAPEQWGLKLYNSFHRPGFGGGPYTTIAAKDGTKLEVAKLKARSKDNDRYVSMIKDLRTTRSRRRRR